MLTAGKHVRYTVLSILVFLVVFTACPGPAATLERFRSSANAGRLVVYLQVPEKVSANITVTLGSVSAVDEQGSLVPFITEPHSLVARKLVGRQLLLGEAAIEAGQYRGLHFTFKEAIIIRGSRKAALSYPKEGWMLEVPFLVGPRDSATLFLNWDPDRSLEMGFFFSPHVTAERESRQVRQLMVYVSNEASDTVSVINREVGRVVGTLAVPRGPRGLAISPDSNSLYVVSSGADRLTRFRTSNNEWLMDFRFRFRSEPQEVAVSPDSSRLFVSLFRLEKLMILDAESLTPIEEVEVGRGPKGVLVEPSGRKVYVANSLSDDVSIISARTGTLLARVSVEPNPQRLAISSDEQEVLVTGYESTFLTAISVATNRVTRLLNTEKWITDILVDPRLNRFYLVQDKNNTLLFYEPTSELPIQTVFISSNPFRIALDPDLRTLFVVSRDTNTVTLVNRITGKVEDVLEVGKSPHDVEVVEVP